MSKKIESISKIILYLFIIVLCAFVIMGVGLTSCVIIYIGKDDKPIQSSMTGEEFEVPPNTGKAKMKDWNGWADRYLNLQLDCERKRKSNEPKTISFDPFDRFTKLKVIEVRTKNYDVGSSYEICILQEVANPKDLISVRCEDINNIKIYNERVAKALELIRTEGKVTITKEINKNIQNPNQVEIKNEAMLWEALANGCRGIGFDIFRIIKP